MTETANLTDAATHELDGTGAALLEIDAEECLRLISPGGVGRVAFNAADGPAILPVNYRVVDGAIVFRIRAGGVMDRDLRTGMKNVDIKIAFEVDEIDPARQEGWSVLVQGPFHQVTGDEVSWTADVPVRPWAGGTRDLYVRVTPVRVTGRRVRPV
ncbi:pyridoxamine 5'-phosphate oxidase family protein [Sphaerisporangium sp. B11E5]|uniref:pyridoxamine 5'-phosphate oxidase family protein n=1 Tax=Sphaerisporangium sp. B11E5 TaxID=3153563 RepID=UPI00325F8969